MIEMRHEEEVTTRQVHIYHKYNLPQCSIKKKKNNENI